MNKGFIIFTTFSCGAVVGFFTGKKMVEQHYNQVVQEEIESVKQAFRGYFKYSGSKDKENPSETDSVVNIKTVQRSAGEKKDYRAYYGNGTSQKKSQSEKEPSKINVIPPNEFDTIGYDTISLKYYANGVVVDDSDEPMTEEEIERSITRESLNHFGEYEPDSVFVRNDDMRIDYEILMDESEYHNN